MTIKNFLKTAVLGIAICSVSGMSSGIAMNNKIDLSDILKKLDQIDNEAGTKKVLKLNNQLSDQLTERYTRIKNTIKNAVYHKINDKNILNEFYEDIGFLQIHQSAYMAIGNRESMVLILKYSESLCKQIKNELDLDLSKILQIIQDDQKEDLERTTIPLGETIEYFDGTIIKPKIDKILEIIENTITNDNISENDYNKLIDNLNFLVKSPLGVKYKSGEGIRNSKYSYIINKINDYSERIKLEAEKYLNKTLKNEGWEILKKT